MHHRIYQAEIIEFQKQREAKARSAISNQRDEQAQQAAVDSMLALQLAGQENGQVQTQQQSISLDADAKKSVACTTAQREFQDAYAILFELKPTGDAFTGEGLPKNLKKMVLEKLGECADVHVDLQIQTSCAQLASYTDSQGNWYIISGDDKGFIRIWDAKNKSLITTLVGHTRTIRQLTTFADDKGNWYIISASSDATVRVWNGITGEIKHILNASDDIFSLITYAEKDGNWYIVAGERGESIRAWNGESGLEMWNTEIYANGMNGPIDRLATCLSPQGERYVISGSMGTACIWDGMTGHFIQALKIGSWVGTHVDKNGNLYIVGAGQTITVWNYNSQSTSAIVKIPKEAGHNNPENNFIAAMKMHVDPDGNLYIIGGTWHESVCVWDGKTGKIKHILKTKNRLKRTHYISALKIHVNSEGAWDIIAGTSEGKIYIWDGETGEMRFDSAMHVDETLETPLGTIRGLAAHIRGDSVECIASASAGKIFTYSTLGPINLNKRIVKNKSTIISDPFFQQRFAQKNDAQAQSESTSTCFIL